MKAFVYVAFAAVFIAVGACTCAPALEGTTCDVGEPCPADARLAKGVCTHCGGPGELCCPGNSCPSRSALGEALSCANDLCVVKNVQAPSGCGGPQQQCCKRRFGGKEPEHLEIVHGVCQPGMTCDQGSCKDECGVAGKPCCDHDACGVGLACTNGVCANCGVVGGCEQVLCRDEQCASDNGAGCVDLGAEEGRYERYCVGDAMSSCGSAGDACCPGNRCTGEGACCVAGTCVAEGDSCGVLGQCKAGGCVAEACGGVDQPCCKPGAGSLPFCTTGTCDAARQKCVACGAPGLPCCDGNVCTKGGCCDHNTNTCIAEQAQCGNGAKCEAGHCGCCGGQLQPQCAKGVGCTAALAFAEDTVCKPCGLKGGPCCPGGQDDYCLPNYACAWSPDGTQGTCVDCGSYGQRCCNGRFCDSGYHCDVQVGTVCLPD